MMHARPLARWIVPTIFAVAAATTGVRSAHNVAHALAHPESRAWLNAVYSLLRTAVTLGFALFTIGRAAPRRPSRSPVAFFACAVALAATIGFAEPGGGTPTGLIIAGELVAIAFAAWLLVAVLYLGRCFGVLPEARGLVTRGPYRVIRHPVYLGEIGACAGLALAAPSARNAAAVITVLAAQLLRMRLEERALTEAFPAYSEYAHSTPRLLPRFRLHLRLARPSASSVVAIRGER